MVKSFLASFLFPLAELGFVFRVIHLTKHSETKKQKYLTLLAYLLSDQFTMGSINAGASILHGLRGTRLYIPDLSAIYDKWTKGLNPHYQRLVPIINEQLDRIVHKQRRLVHYKAMDFALFTAL